MTRKRERTSVSKTWPVRSRVARGFQAMMIAVLLVSSSGCTCTEESYCDISQQFSFLPVGQMIVGNWFWERDAEEADPAFRFNEQGHFVHDSFGCGNHRLPTVPEGMNTGRTDAGYQCTTLIFYEIQAGRFRLEYKTSRVVQWIEGRLLPDGKLELDSNISDDLSGTFVKRPPSTKDGESLVPPEQL